MTERVIKEWDRLVKKTKRNSHWGRRMKRQMRHLLRMNAWDLTHREGGEQK